MRQDVLQNNVIDIVYERDEVFTVDQQEELVDKIIPSISVLDSVNDQVSN